MEGVVKMRDSAFDTAFHDVTIGPGGLQVMNRLILPGLANDNTALVRTQQFDGS